MNDQVLAEKKPAQGGRTYPRQAMPSDAEIKKLIARGLAKAAVKSLVRSKLRRRLVSVTGKLARMNFMLHKARSYE